ncbi:Protein of unknown function [Raineyella antarctica]|uniref:DUF2993 domain-containing protein n=1 Tax=Raineyella antarctica TaxID=1577474 RepID=A0A1G6GG46_9ACTN|nr:DUF2993 domain-containing protein [Raineyella antarctica]SDB80793.1 Protein of unknown function [Raineyella antarctica]
MTQPTIPLPPLGRRRPRRRRGAGIVLALVLLAVLVAGAAALADTIVRQRVQDSVAAQLTRQYTGHGVQVELTGWPFLWQVGQDRLDGGRLRADSLTINAEGRPVQVRDVDLRGTRLTGVRDQQHIVAGTVTGSVELSWQTVRDLSGVDLAYVSANRVRLSESLQLFGRSVPVTIEGTPELDPTNGGLGIRDATATVAGTTVPQGLVDPLLQRVDQGYRLPPLGSLHYDSLAVDPQGVRLQLTGTDVDTQQLLG